MRDPKKKCIAENCEDCQFFQAWDVTEKDTGLRKNVMACSMQVLFDEIPRIRGSVDGCQEAANETRNRVLSFGKASVHSLQGISAALARATSTDKNHPISAIRRLMSWR